MSVALKLSWRLAATLVVGGFLFAGWLAYQTLDTQARLNTALDLGQQAAAAVSKHYQQTQKLPDTVEEVGFVLPTDSVVQTVELDFRMGILSLALRGSGLDGAYLYLLPTADTRNQLTWTCRSKGISEHLLPGGCQPAK